MPLHLPDLSFRPPALLSQAKQHGTEVVDEDGLLDLIRTRPSPARRGKPSAKSKATVKKRPGPELSRSCGSSRPPKAPKLESFSSPADPDVPIVGPDQSSRTEVTDGGVTRGVVESSGVAEGVAAEDVVKSKISPSGGRALI